MNIKIAGKWRFIHLLEWSLQSEAWRSATVSGCAKPWWPGALFARRIRRYEALFREKITELLLFTTVYVYIYINLKFIYIYTCKNEKTSLHRFCLESQGPVSQSRTSEAHRNWRVFLRDWRNRNNCEIKTWISYVGDIAIYQVYSPLCFPLLVLISQWISWISHSYLITRWLIPPLF